MSSPASDPRFGLLSGLLLTLAGVTTEAAVTANSLRLVRTATAVTLTWGGTPPHGLFRAVLPSAIQVQSNRIANTLGTSHDDPVASLTGRLYFYQVGDASACIVASDCDDADVCTVDSCDASGTCVSRPVPGATRTQLAGNSLARYPFFNYVQAFNVDAAVEVAIDPVRWPAVADQTCDVYVVTARTAAEWCADGTLLDARGPHDTRTFPTFGIVGATFPLIAAGQLSADAGTGLGVGYDVVLDCDRNGLLNGTDFIDGLSDGAGLYLVGDLTALGPLPVGSFEEVGPLPEWPGPWVAEGDDMRVWYPSALDSPAFTGTFPLVVISHGNGHRYRWYDFLQEHLASYGFIVFSHDNNTSPGIETASLSTLRWIDRLLDEQARFGGGVLDGHIDHGKMVWIGHSRGGEGVTRAYDRMHDEGWTPAHFTINDIAAISSIAPTDYLGVDLANPHEANYHLLYGAADGDVDGCAVNDTRDSFNIYERAGGKKSSTYLHGADHNDFNCCGFDDFEGPAGTAIGRAEAQQVEKAIYLALVQHYVRGNIPAEDFLWRQNESLRPIGVDPATVIDNDYTDHPAQIPFVIENFQQQPDPAVSSSGGIVTTDVSALVEDLLNDTNTTFNWTAGEPMNGMTRANTDDDPDDLQRGAVFEYTAGGDRTMAFGVIAGAQDFSTHGYLSLRACQRTRHPETTAVLGDLTFVLTLVDGAGRSSSINIGAYGGGVEEPYQRTSCGSSGAGWQNEFEVIRIRLTDFLADGSGLDLTRIATVRLDLGASFGSAQGAVGFDDLHLAAE